MGFEHNLGEPEAGQTQSPAIPGRNERAWRALAWFSPLRIRREVAALSHTIEEVRLHLERRSAELSGETGSVRAELHANVGATHALRYNARSDRLLAAMLWIEAAEVSEDALVSVITPTYNRAHSLLRAIASVRAQTYSNWEMLVLDDGSSDETVQVVESVADPRVRLFQLDHGGQARARNKGLAEARGRVIAYLDDDNTLHRGWLRSLAWAFDRFHGSDVVYGAHVREDDSQLADTENLGLPVVFFRPFDRRELEEYSYIDVGSIGHRAALPGAYFDERFTVAEDYDLILRLTQDKPALALPVVACLYGMLGADRRSSHGPVDEEVRDIRERLSRPAPPGAEHMPKPPV